MWVADMDFEIAKPISDAVKKRAEHAIYGYSIKGRGYYDAVINWMKKRHNWDVKKEWISYTPGIVPALGYIVRTFAQPGDEIFIQTPIYHPFYSTIKNNGYTIVKNPLLYEDGNYKMDLEDLTKKITLENYAANEVNAFASVALIAAYNEGEEWLKQVLENLEGNLKFLMSFIEERIPKIKVVKPQGTYLVWLDTSALNMTSQRLKEFFIKKAKVGFNDGIMFGEEGDQFQRINIACQRSTLKEALERIERAYLKC